MDMLHPLDISARLADLAKLTDGWYDGSGSALDAGGLKQFEDLFEEGYDKSLPVPTIFPTLEGNIQLEWSAHHYEASLEVNLSDFSAGFIAVNTLSEESEEVEYDLQDRRDWKRLNDLLLLGLNSGN